MTGKRFTLLYGIDENPFDWDIIDNEKDALICQCNGSPICNLLNELDEENKQLKKRVEELECKLQFKKDLEEGNFIELTAR